MLTTNTLKEVVDALVLEALRGFNLGKFKTLPSTDSRIEYARKFLPEMGEGSSRIVFAISGGKVLKIASNVKGFAQNEAEIDIFTNPKTKPVVARIFDAGQKNDWLISEIVQPFPNNSKAWKQSTGMNWDYWSSFIREWNEEGRIEAQAWITHKIQDYTEDYRDLESTLRPDQHPHSYSMTRLKAQLETVQVIQKSQFALGIMELIVQGLEPGDLIGSSVGHYGKTVDGRVVVLDYGFTKEVRDEHYSW